MAWPERIDMATDTTTALVDSTAQWNLEELEQPDLQQRALRQCRVRVRGLTNLLTEVTEVMDRTGAVIVSGFPPESAALVVFASALGEVNAHFNGPEPGTLVHELIAKAAPKHRDADPPHNDSVWLERPHAYIGLVCIQPSSTSDGLTVLIRAVDIAAALRGRGVDIAPLHDPCFPFAEPDPKDPTAGPPTVHLRAILSGAGKNRTVLWRPTRVAAGRRLRPDALDEVHRSALDAFTDVLADPALGTLTLLGEGDLLLLDNRSVLHGRTPIAPGGSDRYLKRVKIHA